MYIRGVTERNEYEMNCILTSLTSSKMIFLKCLKTCRILEMLYLKVSLCEWQFLVDKMYLEVKDCYTDNVVYVALT